MKEYLLGYKAQIQHFIDKELEKTSIEEINRTLSNFETQISYFQHERLVHLLVTLTFAIFEIISIVTINIVFSPVMIILSILFLVLLVPYIFHYYFLENNVQEFYKMRDKIVDVKNKRT